MILLGNRRVFHRVIHEFCIGFSIGVSRKPVGKPVWNSVGNPVVNSETSLPCCRYALLCRLTGILQYRRQFSILYTLHKS